MTIGGNSRFACYARVHGRTTLAQLAHDQKTWPGGVMGGFVLWNLERIREFAKIDPEAVGTLDGRPTIIDHDAYDQWLAKLPVMLPDMKLTPALAEPEMQVYEEVS